MVNNARIILELLITNDKDRAEQISKYLYNTRNILKYNKIII